MSRLQFAIAGAGSATVRRSQAGGGVTLQTAPLSALAQASAAESDRHSTPP